MYLPNILQVTHGRQFPDEVLHLRNLFGKGSPVGEPTKSTALPVEYSAVDDKETQMAKHAAVSETDELTLQDNWRNQVDIPPSYEEHRRRIIAMLEVFQTMWDGRLMTIKAAKHRN